MAEDDAVRERIDEIVARLMRDHRTPGMAVALTDRERLLHVASYGVADVAARTPVAPETLFEIGSIGKAFTAVALLRLRDEGRVDLQAPVTRYLPWFAVGGAEAPITLHHLLTHTGGIVAGMDATPDARSEVWALRHTRVGGPPGERFHYSNVGYKTLGLVLQAITGEPYGETIGDLLIELGMEDSEPTITHDTRRRLAVGYAPLYDDRPAQPNHPLVPATWLETDTADGSIAATAADLAAFLRMLLNRGVGPRGRVLSEEGFASMTRPVGAATDAGYGYGLFVREADEGTEIGHPGGMVGYLASMRGDPDAGLGVAVLCNGPGAPVAVGRAALRLLRAVAAGHALPPPEDDEGVANAADYVGSYVAGGWSALRPFSISVADGGLRLAQNGAEAPLAHRWDDDFVVDVPGLDRFALRFDRDEAGQVIGATHGGDRYGKDGLHAPPQGELPEKWLAYAGRYRSHNPWIPTFVVLPRGDRLWLLFPAGEPDGFEEEQPLVPLAGDSFRAGDDSGIPERIRFDTLVGGVALRATLSGADYWRTSNTR